MCFRFGYEVVVIYLEEDYGNGIKFFKGICKKE